MGVYKTMIKAVIFDLMKGIWKSDVNLSNVEADFIINDLSEIPRIIGGIVRE